MMTLITGGSKCGKSRCAESLLDGFSGTKIYLATMRPEGQEAQEAIIRHREMRRCKGFRTIEQYTDLDSLRLPKYSAVLLECMGNLLANEMFRGGEICSPAEKIIHDIRILNLQADMLVIVSNQVGGDGIAYDSGTAAYIAALGQINCALAAEADTVIECVYGIPVVLKGVFGCSNR